MNLLVKSCLRKWAYTEAEARQLVRLSHRQRGDEGRQHAYRCGACGCWHVGHLGRHSRRK
jgi:hypothetical protein